MGYPSRYLDASDLLSRIQIEEVDLLGVAVMVARHGRIGLVHGRAPAGLQQDLEQVSVQEAISLRTRRQGGPAVVARFYADALGMGAQNAAYGVHYLGAAGIRNVSGRGDGAPGSQGLEPVQGRQEAVPG